MKWMKDSADGKTRLKIARKAGEADSLDQMLKRSLSFHRLTC
jgi:hypothetical protein